MPDQAAGRGVPGRLCYALKPFSFKHFRAKQDRFIFRHESQSLKCLSNLNNNPGQIYFILMKVNNSGDTIHNSESTIFIGGNKGYSPYSLLQHKVFQNIRA